MNRFGRADVLRILHISAKQLAGWQRAGLAPISEEFSFCDLIQLTKVRDLRAKRVRPAAIRESLQAMQRQVAGMENPLIEASAIHVGGRVAFRHSGHTMEPVAGQYVMDFGSTGAVVTTPAKTGPSTADDGKVKQIPGSDTVHELFTRGVSLEEHPDNHDEAIKVYLQILEIEPEHAAAHINVGTLYYNRQNFVLAETHYRAAVASDARYALAHFDLGNVLDETGRFEEAVVAYKTAIQLAPTYADAHYNLALAYERLREPRKALLHWKAYIKLDRTGPWSVHAHNQIARILESDRLKIVFKREA